MSARESAPPAGGSARRLRVCGVVQGVGFRPFVFRLAARHRLTGWVLNGTDGVDIHVEGPDDAIEAFARELVGGAPAAASIASVAAGPAAWSGCDAFEIRESARGAHPTAPISPDLPTCAACLAELFDPAGRRFGYPCINCASCGPRYSIIRSLPYDRPRTTMAAWPMCGDCRREYDDVSDRRFHAQPNACPACGPHYVLERGAHALIDADAIREAARLLSAGAIVGVKGIGGYHVACDATSRSAVRALRERKFRKERPFAIMVQDLDTARQLVDLQSGAELLLQSAARPIVVAPARIGLDEVAPDNGDLGVMLPYAPVHHLLFASGAPRAIVLTSGNRSSEPIAYEDEDARTRLCGIADALLRGERPIARRVDDSVVCAGAHGTMVLRRARGMAPGVVARLPAPAPILAVGADLKNAPTLVVGGEAFVAQHVGDLDHHDARAAFDRTLHDLTAMYDIDPGTLTVVHDAHPEYTSTARAVALPAGRHIAVQHHRAHIASVLAERGALDTRVLGIAFDGTGYGDDGTIWGGEIFAGSVREGLTRVAHLRPAGLVGGDAAARMPVQAAAGFLAGLDEHVDLTAPPFSFPARYRHARRIAAAGVRVFQTTSVGRLFDAVAALLGFVRPVTFEGQAAIWLEHLARPRHDADAYEVPFADDLLDYRPALAAIIDARRRGGDPAAIARAFHNGLARGVADAAAMLADGCGVDIVVLSGGVFQNALLLSSIHDRLTGRRLRVWTNHAVPANDGGISLGQAAIAAVLPEVGGRERCAVSASCATP
jgi:hydrogenase maturation protein HypF